MKFITWRSSHVAVSFEEPEYTADSDGIGVLRLFKSMKSLGIEKMQILSSINIWYGLVREIPQTG